MKQILGRKERDVLCQYVGKDFLRRLDENRNFFSALDEGCYYLTFTWLDGQKADVYASRGDFVVVTDSDAVADYARKVDVPENGLLQLHEFLLELTASDVDKLESLENLIISLEDNLLMDKSPGKSGIKDIVKVRKDLLKIKRYYEQMEFLTDAMFAVDPTFAFIDKKFHRLLEFVLHLQEYIESVRDAYQAQIEIEQNHLMKLFTVITSIFLPLTLLVGWYGMNLSMPEYQWRYGYAYVIGFSIVLVLVLLGLFKRKKWF